MVEPSSPARGRNAALASVLLLLAAETLSAAPAPRFRPAPGFHVDIVAEGVGSLIALSPGERGELWVAAEGEGIKRLVDADGDGRYEGASPALPELADVHGLAYVGGVLWATGRDTSKNYGLWQVDPQSRLATRAGQFRVSDAGHGAHAVVPGRDGRLYVTLGNHARLLEPAAADSPYAIAYEGNLLPAYSDPRGYGKDVRAPGGTIVSFDPRTRAWRTVAGGLRNVYDFAFNKNGDIIAFDSDMEWDLGLPWYRPVHAIHVVPGGDYGSRTGSSPWPEWYPDSVGSLMALGRGSPTGMLLYDRDAFPARLQGAVLVGDWSQGRLLALKLSPRGASYGGEIEVLLEGQPLNVCDLALDRDGSVLFVTGGWGSMGGVYRLVADTAPEPQAGDPFVVPARRLLLTGLTPETELLALLGDPERLVRYLAARELERRPPSAWQSAAPGVADPLARAEAVLALARLGLSGREGVARDPIIETAAAELEKGARGTTRLVLLRALELALAREPSRSIAPAGLGKRLLALYPSGERESDRALRELIAFLAPEGAVGALHATFRREQDPVERIHLVYALRVLESGWTGEQKLEVMGFLASMRSRPGGSSYLGYLDFLSRDIKRLLSPEELKRLPPEPTPLPPPPATTTKVRTRSPEPRLTPKPAPWSEARLVAYFERALAAPRRSPAEGALVFQRNCASCHRHGQTQGGPGPDLSTVGARFSLADLVASLVAPSRAITEAYRSLVVRTTDGQTLEGMPALDQASGLTLLLSDGKTTTVPSARIASRKPSERSLMPEGMLDGLSREEGADLLAFLLSASSPPVPSASRWQRLFDGVSLMGLDGDPAVWRVEGGEVVGRARDLPAATYLISRQPLRDFVLEAEIRVVAGNSGLQFRAARGAGFALLGLQADAGQDHWGELYHDDSGTVARVAARALATAGLEPGGWNHYVVEASGAKIRLELNGVTTAEWNDPAPRDGLIGLQVHGAGGTEVRFRNLRVRPGDGR